MASAEAVSFVIAEYLQQLLEKKALGEDAIESVEVAIQCLQVAFNVNLQSQEQRTKYSLISRQTTLSDLCNGALARAPQESSAPPSTSSSSDASKIAAAEQFKNQGNVQLKDKLYDAAVESYTKAIELAGNNSVYYANRAAAYICTRAFAEAEKDCEQSIKLDPTYVKAYGRLGLARFRLGRLDEALKAYKRAIELEPTNEKLRQEMKQVEDKISEQSAPRASQPPPFNLPDGMPDMSAMLNNPGLMSMASQMMQSGAFNNLLSNPAFAQMAESMLGGAGAGGSGGMPPFGNIGQHAAEGENDQ